MNKLEQITKLVNKEIDDAKRDMHDTKNDVIYAPSYVVDILQNILNIAKGDASCNQTDSDMDSVHIMD